MRNVAILGIFVVVALVAYFAFIKGDHTPFVKKADINLAETDFGYTTLKLLGEGTHALSCEDSKEILTMIVAVGDDFATNPEASSSDNLTPAMIDFELTMNTFSQEIGAMFANDNETANIVFEKIGNDMSRVFQIAIINSIGAITNEEVDEYMNVTFCGVAPSENYIDPILKMEQFVEDNATTDNVSE